MKWIYGRSLVFACLLCFAALAKAQDAFEIHVLEYEQLQPAEFSFENHLNFVGAGTKASARTVAPSAHQLRMTYELTGGITNYASLGIMQLNAIRPGGSLEYAGWRIVPHFYAPQSWHLPVNIGLVAEVSFEKPLYSQDSRLLTIIPIVQRKFGRVKADLNPAFGRALHGPGTNNGWDFEPAGRLGYDAWRRFTPSLEYYSAWGDLRGFLPARQQIHQIFAGGMFI